MDNRCIRPRSKLIAFGVIFSINVLGAYLFDALGATATFRQQVGTCNDQAGYKSKTATGRLAACNYIISAGPRGGATGDEHQDNIWYVAAFFNRAETYSQLGQYEKSVQDFDSYRKNCEQFNMKVDAFLYRERAAVQFLMKEYDAAKTDLQRAEDISGALGSYKGKQEAGLRGDIAMEERDFEAAKKFYALAITAWGNGEALFGGKLKLAERLASAPKSPSQPTPAGPIIQKSDSAGCQLYPNLC